MNYENYEKSIKEIESLFTAPSFNTFWSVIDQRSYQMGFSDKLTDAEKIEEYQYITQQYRKYISSKEKTILAKKDNLEDMLAIVEDLISKAPEFDPERKMLIYFSLRDDWLVDLYNQIVTALQQREEDEDGE